MTAKVQRIVPWKETASEELCLEVKGGGDDREKTWLFCHNVCSVVSKA